MNKQSIKTTMLALEEAELSYAKEKYRSYLESAHLDSREPLENDELAQAEIASDLAEAFDQPIHAHDEKIERLKHIDFGPKDLVEEGAVVKLSGRYFVISVSTSRFTCEGENLMGISTMAPIYKVMEGKAAGDTCEFNGREIVVEEVI
jgi:hypothetical protein